MAWATARAARAYFGRDLAALTAAEAAFLAALPQQPTRFNPWKDAAGIPLADFLATPMEQYRQAMGACVKYAGDADSSRDPLAPAYAVSSPLTSRSWTSTPAVL